MRFEKRDDCFLDTETGLEWELIQSEEKMSYENAQEYCEKLGQGWKLPTDKELESIIDRAKCAPATELPDIILDNYWSATNNTGSADNAWYVNFNYGFVVNYYKSNSYYVRAVRGGHCELCGKHYETVKYLDQCPECGRIQKNKRESEIVEEVKRKEIEEKYKFIGERLLEKKKQIEKELKAKEISQGPKFDSGKARFDLIPTYPLWELAKIFNIGGGIKYPEHSWEKGILFSRIYGALQRHINLFWSGESLDPEDNLHHLAHAMWGLVVLMEYEKNFGDKFDDRTFSLPENYKKTFGKEDLKRSGE